MTLSEIIKKLQEIESRDKGELEVRCYSESQVPKIMPINHVTDNNFLSGNVNDEVIVIAGISK